MSNSLCLLFFVYLGMCMLGSGIIGYIVDITHTYKLSIIISAFLSAIGIQLLKPANNNIESNNGFTCFFLFVLSAILYFISSSSFVNSNFHIIVSISLCGFFIGPLQPIAIEAGVGNYYTSSSSHYSDIVSL